MKDTGREGDSSNCLDILHIARGFIFIARLVATHRAHLVFVAVVFVGIFG
jgi:hypothetical protein